MKSYLTPAVLIVVSLTLMAAGQTPAPPQPSPSTQPPTSPPPAQPPAPMVPILPHDPATLTNLQHAIHEEDRVNKEATDFWNDGNKKLQQLQAQRDAFEKIVQDEIADIRKREGWGPEIVYNRVTGKFERPLPTKKETK